MDGSFNSWPAELSKVHDNVITVAATDSDGSFASYCIGELNPFKLRHRAPRLVALIQTVGMYTVLGLMAAPHVAGAAALLWAERPELSY